ncbi:hypothetical protein [Hymenobacter glacieicola]|uniref:Uncharacterized protein n=1 Tax=Hymenobacter glacieicola TaxID=1562124 RepID=A0ABQ1WY37_9BACT|nr:hypothetical protein [Hymenobacter glacieicola]GGG46257.1 hypothetical protein GCM10011378_23070 [Hymenobacter glacieicola]
MLLTPTFRYRPALLFGGLSLTLIGVEILIIRRPDFSLRPALPAAVCFDLLTMLPLLFYWQVVRPYQLPKGTVVAAFSAAVALAYALLPSAQQHYLGWTSYALAGAEVLTAGVLLLNLSRIRRAFSGRRATEPDYLEALTAAFNTVLGRSLAPVVAEIGMLYYALCSWRTTPEARATDQAFTNYQDSGTTALLATIGLLWVLEMGAAHMLLAHWWPALTMPALVLHVYGLLFLLGHIRAIRLRPTLLTGQQQVVVRVGFLWQLRVPLSAVAEVRSISQLPVVVGPQMLNSARFLLTPPNVWISFTEPMTLSGPYGSHRQAQYLALYLDQPAAFITALTSRMVLAKNAFATPVVGNNP